MTGWRTALRIARREARRAKGRATLVVAMIAVPVAALAFGVATFDMFRLTPDERADRIMGAAQALVAWPYDGPAVQGPEGEVFFPARATGATPPGPAAAPGLDRLLALLPAGTRAIGDQAGHLTVHTASGTGTVEAHALDYTDPLARGRYRQVSGTAPANPDEAVLTPAAARRLGVGPGGTVRLADGSRTFRVAGIVEDPDHLSVETIVLRPGAVPAATLSADRAAQRWLVAMPTPMTWADVKRLNSLGVVATSRYVLAHPPGVDEQYAELHTGGSDPTPGILVLVGGLAMLEIVLLAGPAFAVSARRRQRDLALVAAAGATPAHLRRIVLADGVVLGALAAAAGIALGVVVAAVTRPVIEVHLAHLRAGGFRVFPLALAVIAGLAVVTGLLAALVPAWIAARQDVVATLAGRRGVTRSRRRWVVLGVLLIASGAGTATVGAGRINTTVILIGLVVVELGLVLCTPAVVGLMARLGRWLPVAPRIALRDAARNRAAAAPAVAAVLAAVIGSVAVGVVVSASDARATRDYRSSTPPGTVALYSVGGRNGLRSVPPEALAAVRGILPVDRIHEINHPSCGGEPCAVDPQAPADRACPYTAARLGHDPSQAEQRAARRDRRCDGVGQMATYFGGGVRSARGVTVIIADTAVGAVTVLPTEDTDRAAAALRAGQIVVDDPRYLDNGRVTLAITAFSPDGTDRQVRTVSGPGFVLPHRPPAPITMMTPATARSLGLDATLFVTLVTTSRVPTVAEQDRLQAALTPFNVDVRVEHAPERNMPALIVLVIVAGVITLGAAAIATGLAATDGRADLTTLAAVGASPRLRRALSLSQSGVIAGLGSLIGTVAGLGASFAVLAALNQRFAQVWPAPTPYPLAIPWLNVGVALLVVPLVAMLGAGLLTRSRLPVERRL